MPVYVDDMYKTPMGQFGRMKMSHMCADSTEELLAMARKIGLNAKWLQKKGQGPGREHFDVSMSLRAKAVASGAVEVTMRDMSRIFRDRRPTKETPNDR